LGSRVKSSVEQAGSIDGVVGHDSCNALPNESRLSCGAMVSLSQTEDLHSKTAASASGAC